MKLQKNTLILLIIAILLGLGTSVYEFLWKPQQEQIQSQTQKIFSFNKQDVKELTVETKGKTLQFKHTGDEGKPWLMQQPEETTASEPAISFLLDLLLDRKSDRRIKISGEQKKEFGLEPPSAKITVKLANGESHQIILGDTDLEDLYIYAQIDPQKQGEKEIEIALVPKELQYALERDLQEWKQIAEPSETKTKTPD